MNDRESTDLESARVLGGEDPEGELYGYDPADDDTSWKAEPRHTDEVDLSHLHAVMPCVVCGKPAGPGYGRYAAAKYPGKGWVHWMPCYAIDRGHLPAARAA